MQIWCHKDSPVKKPARAGFFARARPLTNARVIACWFWPIADDCPLPTNCRRLRSR